MKSIRFCQNIKLSRNTSASSAAHSLGNTGLWWGSTCAWI